MCTLDLLILLHRNRGTHPKVACHLCKQGQHPIKFDLSTLPIVYQTLERMFLLIGSFIQLKEVYNFNQSSTCVNKPSTTDSNCGTHLVAQSGRFLILCFTPAGRSYKSIFSRKGSTAFWASMIDASAGLGGHDSFRKHIRLIALSWTLK